jgi:PAS domain S-box-containing protein
MTGYSREELLEKSSLMLYPTVEEYERVGLVKYNMISERGTGYVETRWQRKDGSIVDILLSSSPIIPGDLSKEITFSALDITERKQHEEALKKANEKLEEKVKERTKELQKAYNSLKESEESLIEAQKIAHIGSWDNNLVIGKLHWSEEMYHIFGLNPQEPMTYDKFLSCIHPDDRDYVYNSTREAFNGNVYMTEYRIVRPNGEERIVQSEREVFFDENNKPIRMTGTIQDITERKKTEADLSKMEKIRIKEIHHRIKNNLQVISSLLDLQKGRFSHLDICKVPDVIEAFTESQNRVISMALIHEKLYKGGDIETLNFSGYIKDLTDNLFLTYQLGNVNISLSIDIDDDIFFDMDTAVPLGIIVNELVSNALKHAFSGRDKGKIIIELHREKCKIEDNKSTLYTLSVSDNGIGIPEYLEIDDVVDTLGMQLINSLVDQLDGKLELNRDKGTEFIIKFTVTEETNQAHLK